MNSRLRRAIALIDKVALVWSPILCTQGMRALLGAAEQRVLELLAERERTGDNAERDRALREQLAAAQHAAQSAREELAASLSKGAQLDEQVEALVVANKRAADDIQRARLLERKRVEEIARLEAQLRAKHSAQAAVSEWQQQCEALRTANDKMTADAEALRADSTQVRTEMQVRTS